MKSDRQRPPEERVAAFPREFDDFVAGAATGGLGAIKRAGEMLLDYVAARSVTDDPGFEDADTWNALRSAAEVTTDYVVGCVTPVGEEVSCWVEYLHCGFDFEQQFEATVDEAEWILAFRLATICKAGRQLSTLVEIAQDLAELQTAEIRAYVGTREHVATREPVAPDALLAEVLRPRLAVVR
jgi:hypothetical protein